MKIKSKKSGITVSGRGVSYHFRNEPLEIPEPYASVILRNPDFEAVAEVDKDLEREKRKSSFKKLPEIKE